VAGISATSVCSSRAGYFEAGEKVRLLLLCMASGFCVLLGTVPAAAQSGAADAGADRPARESDEEVVVRGRRLGDFRAELDLARVRVYDVFNEINSDDAFDVSCAYEDSTGSRMRQHVCRPRYETDISTDAASQWRYGLISACGGVTQECIFSESAQLGMSMAQGAESPQAMMQKRFADELARAIVKSPELQEAILEYQSLESAYQAARGRTGN